MGNLLLLIPFGLLAMRSTYWIFAVWEKENPGLKVLVGQIGELILLLFIFTQIVEWKVLPMPQSFLGNVFGFFLAIGGVVIGFMGKKQLGENWHHAGSSKKPRKLVITGIYKYVRHPIYIGYILSFIGIELMLSSYLWISFLGFLIPLYFQAKTEEKLLGEVFGKKFIFYKKRTKLFLPYLW